MLSEHSILSTIISCYCSVPFEILRPLKAQIRILPNSSSLIIEIIFYAPWPPHKELEYDKKKVYTFLFSILPPIDNDLLGEKKGHVIHVCTIAFSEGTATEKTLLHVNWIPDWHWTSFPFSAIPENMECQHSQTYLAAESPYFSIFALPSTTPKSNLLF